MSLTTRMKMDRCPACGKTLDAASNLDYHTPQPGDVSVCINCQAILQWNSEMRLQKTELSELPANVAKQVLGIIGTMRAVLPRMRHRNN